MQTIEDYKVAYLNYIWPSNWVMLGVIMWYDWIVHSEKEFWKIFFWGDEENAKLCILDKNNHIWYWQIEREINVKTWI